MNDFTDIETRFAKLRQEWPQATQARRAIIRQQVRLLEIAREKREGRQRRLA